TWSLSDGRLLGEAPLMGVTRELSWPRYYAEFFPDGNRLISIDSAQHVLKSWAAETGREMMAYHGHTNQIRAVAVSPDGRWVVSAAPTKESERPGSEIRVWDAGSGSCRTTLEVPHSRVISMAMSPDGRRLAVGGANMAHNGPNATMSLWDIETRKRIKE